MQRLNYALSGDERDPAILFLHGFMGRAEDWAAVVAALDGRFHCVAPDLPGHGDSCALSGGAYTIGGAAGALRELLADVGIRRCAVAGYSMGGRLALYFALQHPDRCSRLVLESASPGLETAAAREERRRTDEARARRIEAEGLDDFLSDWYRQPLFASLADHEGMVERMIDRRQRNEPRELGRSLRSMGTGTQPSLWERLPELRMPTLFLTGALDAKYVRIGRRMAARCARLRVATVPGAGHNVRAERPEAYLRRVGDFLEHR